MRRTIATGGKAGAGKDYVLNRLLAYEAGQYGSVIIGGFGDLVRAELEIEDPKENRPAQQFHGQFRRKQDPDYWTKKAVEWAIAQLRTYDAVGFTGVRFLNEIEVLREAGFYLVLVEAPEAIRKQRLFRRDGRIWTEAEMNHRTETSLDQIPREKWDAVWLNS